MPFRVLVISLLTLLVAWDVAYASDDEIRQQRALLIFEDFRHWVNLRYQFVDQKNNNFSSSSHQMQENYNASLDGSILNPHLFNANLTFSIGSDQNFYSNAGQSSNRDQSVRYNYQFTGAGLDRSITPFTVSSYRNTETVITPFSPSYTSNTSGNELKATLRNSFLPCSFSYSRKTIDNSGGNFDSSTVTDSFSYSTTHQYKDISSSSLSLTGSQSSGTFAGGTAQTARAFSASLGNTLQWGPEQKYSLTTVGQVYDTVDQDVPQRNVTLSETFQDHLGKALDLQMSYGYSKNTSSGSAEIDSQNSEKTAEVILTHHLFESLTTRLRGKYSHHDPLNGTEERYSGTGELNYIKKLPGGDHLTLSANGGHEVIDNQLGAANITFNDKPFNAVHRGGPLSLNLGTQILKAVTVVKSLNPAFTYVEGIDYTVDLVRGEIDIPPDSRIDMNDQGIDLMISYTVFIDPTLKYASDSFNVSGGLTMRGGRYSVGGSYMDQWMTLLKGSNENSLRNSNLKMLYFNGNLEPLSYRVTVTASDVGSLTSRAIDSSAQYITDLPVGRVAFSGTERYSWFSASGNVPAYGENTTALSASGMRGLGSHMRLTISGNWYDTRSDIRGAKDIATLRANLLFVMNKTMINMDGQTSWNITSGSVTRNDTVTIDFSRYF
jgi:hypothetical protein